MWEVCNKMGGVVGMRVSHCEFSLSSYLLFFLQTWDPSCVGEEMNVFTHAHTDTTSGLDHPST